MNVFIEQIEKIYNQKKKLFNTLITLGYSFLLLNLWLSYPLLGWLIFYIPTVFFIYLNYKKIIFIGKQWIKLFLGFSGLFFICKIYAEKLLNYHFDIEVQYLSYSSTIYAALLAIILGATIIFLRYFSPYLLKSMGYWFAGFFSKKYREKTQTLGFYFQPFILIGLFLPVVFSSSFIEKFTYYYVIADAYTVSNCGEKIEDIFYIRKNDSQCYAIKLAIPPKYETVNSVSNK